MKTEECLKREEILFDELFYEELSENKNICCSLALAPNNQLFALKKLGSYNDAYDSLYIYNHNLQKISSFFCGNGGEQGLVFWPDNQHILTGGYTRSNVDNEKGKLDGLKLFDIYNPDIFINPFLELKLKEISTIHCEVNISSSDGQYILVSNHDQILIDTINLKWWKVHFESRPIAFSEQNKYLLTSLHGNYYIYDVEKRELVFSGFGFLGYSPTSNTLYTHEYSNNQWVIREQTIEGEFVRRINYNPKGLSTNVSLDNQWMAFGFSNGSLCVINLNDPSQIFSYHETTKTSRFIINRGYGHQEIYFLSNSRFVIVHYWGLGIRIFEY